MIKLTESHPFEGGNRREVDFLHAINAITASLQSAAHSETAVFNTFTAQFVKLGLYGSINLIDATGQYLVVRAIAMPVKLQKIMQTLETRSNFNLVGYRYTIDKTAFNKDVIKNGKTVFMADNSQKIQDILPKVDQTAMDLMIKYFAGYSMISAPIFAHEGKVQGLLYAVGEWLTESDVPAMTAFANHISIALQNTRLIQEMQTAKTSSG